MYVDPFGFGVFFGIVATIVAEVVYVIIKNRRK